MDKSRYRSKTSGDLDAKWSWRLIFFLTTLVLSTLHILPHAFMLQSVFSTVMTVRSWFLVTTPVIVFPNHSSVSRTLRSCVCVCVCARGALHVYSCMQSFSSIRPQPQFGETGRPCECRVVACCVNMQMSLGMSCILLSDIALTRSRAVPAAGGCLS